MKSDRKNPANYAVLTIILWCVVVLCVCSSCAMPSAEINKGLHKHHIKLKELNYMCPYCQPILRDSRRRIEEKYWGNL